MLYTEGQKCFQLDIRQHLPRPGSEHDEDRVLARCRLAMEVPMGPHPWQADDQEAIPDVDTVPDLKCIPFTYF